MNLSADAVVVGAGAAGATVAAELARRGAKVVVLEEGPRPTEEDRRGNIALAVRKFYRNAGAVVTLGRPPVMVQVGRAVGGSTLINGGTCFRIPDATLDEWATRAGHEFVAAEMTSYFERIEKMLSVSEVPEAQAFIGEQRLLARARARGDRAGMVKRNALLCQGSHLCPFVCPTGAKQSVDLSVLPGAEAQGVVIQPNTQVDKILVEGRRVVGVLATQHGQTVEIAAPLVALCAGSLHSPGILRKSLGKSVPAPTGKSLFLHPGAHVVGLFEQPFEPRSGPIQSVFVNGPGDHYIIFGMGYPIELVSVLTLKPGADLSNLAKFNRSLTLAVMVRDHASSGGIGVDSGGGVVLPHYAFHRNDARHLLEGIAHASELLLEMGAREVFVGLRGLAPLTNVEEARALTQKKISPSRFVLGSVHPMGTAPMGPPGAGVVDGNLRVHGFDGLYLPDASFFPSSLGVNPQVTIMAFALRAAEKMS